MANLRVKVSSRDLIATLLLWAWLAAAAAAGRAATVVLTPAADTTLHERFPGNNLGAHFDIAVGAVGNGERTRGLLRFELPALPAEARITGVSLSIAVTRQPSAGGPASVFALHRLHRMWVEGTRANSTGLEALPGETTWNSIMHPGMPWTAPGGQAGPDYEADASATLLLNERGRYSFASTRELIADVEVWRQNPAANFGWILISRGEGTAETARRIGSREDPLNAPMLTVEYEIGEAQLLILPAKRNGSSLEFSWAGGRPPFQIQRRLDLTLLTWENIGTPVSNRNFSAALDLPAAFFRVIETNVVAATNAPPPDPGGQTNTPPPPPLTNTVETADYEAVFRSDWSALSHPQEFPLGAHWSPLVGGTHSAGASFWSEGVLATRGIEDVAEVGSVVALRAEMSAAIAAGTAFNVFSRPGSIAASGTAAITFTIHRDFPLVTLVTMIAPSPDWFTGVHDLSLLENGQWVERRQIVLGLYDAGTDSGATYNSLDADTQPRQRIRQITGFPALVNGQLVPFGTLTFTRKR